MMLHDLRKEAEKLILDHKIQGELAKLCEENGLLYDSFFGMNDHTQTHAEQCLENLVLRKLLLEKLAQTKSEDSFGLNDFSNKELGMQEKKTFQLF